MFNVKYGIKILRSTLETRVIFNFNILKHGFHKNVTLIEIYFNFEVPTCILLVLSRQKGVGGILHEDETEKSLEQNRSY